MMSPKGKAAISTVLKMITAIPATSIIQTRSELNAMHHFHETSRLESCDRTGWLKLHESGTYVKFTAAGAELFALKMAGRCRPNRRRNPH
jgi:hypothetical protein